MSRKYEAETAQEYFAEQCKKARNREEFMEAYRMWYDAKHSNRDMYEDEPIIYVQESTLSATH